MLNRCRFNQWHTPFAGITRWQYSLALLFLSALADRHADAAQAKNNARDSADSEQTAGKVDTRPKADDSPRVAGNQNWDQIAFRLANDLEIGTPDSVRRAEEELLAIRDAAAVPALARVYGRLRNENRLCLIKALGNIPGGGSSVVLAKWAIVDPDRPLRNAASDQLTDRPDDRPQYQRVFLEALQSKKADPIDAAAEAIRRLRLTDMIPSLSRALVTRERRVFVEQEKLRTVIDAYPNAGVYYALMELTGQDFGYDTDAWLRWWSAVQLTQTRPDLTKNRQADAVADNPDVAKAQAPDGLGSLRENAAGLQLHGKQAWNVTFFRLAQRLESGNDELIRQAEQELPLIRDPVVVPIIMEYMYRVREQSRERLVRVLGQIDDTRASVALANVAVLEPTIDVRSLAIRLLLQRPKDDQSEIQRVLLQGLRSRVQLQIDNSATAIAEMDATNMIYALIESLDAMVTVVNMETSSWNFTRRVLGTTEFSGRSRRGPVRRDIKFNQEGVLKSLTTLTGQDFGFDKSAWKTWFRAHSSKLQNRNEPTVNRAEASQINTEPDPPRLEHGSIDPH